MAALWGYMSRFNTLVGTGAIITTSITYGNNKYGWELPHKIGTEYPYKARRYFSRRRHQKKEFDNKMFNVVTRPWDGQKRVLMTGGKIGVLVDKLDAKDKVKKSKTYIIMNVGKRRQGKSTNSCIESLILCNSGCHFEIGNTTDDCTLGLDMSPPLQPALRKLYPKVSINAKEIDSKCSIVIVDIEGFDSNNKSEMMELVEELLPQTSVIVHSCINSFDDEDIKLCQEIHDILEMHAEKPTYIFAVATSLTELEAGGRWNSLKQIDEDMCVCKLPIFGEDDVGDRIADAVAKQIPANLLRMMGKRHIEKYLDFGNNIAERLDSNHTNITDIKQTLNTIQYKVSTEFMDQTLTKNIN